MVVPISSLATMFPCADGPRIRTPSRVLPEMTLPAPVVREPTGWPITLLADRQSTPSPPLSRMKLPWIRLPAPMAPQRTTPASALFSNRLRPLGRVPPMTLFEQATITPAPPLPAAVPPGVTPIQSLQRVVPMAPYGGDGDAGGSRSTPDPLKPVMLSPSTVQLYAWMTRPSAPGYRALEIPDPSISMGIDALSPVSSVLTPPPALKPSMITGRMIVGSGSWSWISIGPLKVISLGVITSGLTLFASSIAA